MGALLSARGLRVEQGKRLSLDVPALDVHHGEVLAVLGPNGAGKSTLLRCLSLLQRPSEGVIHLEGLELHWRDAVSYRRRTAMLFQDPLLFDTTVRENVAAGLRLRGVRGSDLCARVDPWLERLAISHLAQRSARTLSRGEAQRTSLARAFVVDPEIIFLDEPFSGLDAPTRGSFVRDLRGLLEDQQTTTILVTHDAAEARALAHRVAVLLDGQIAEIGEARAVLDYPTEPRVADFLRSADLAYRLPVTSGAPYPSSCSTSPICETS